MPLELGELRAVREVPDDDGDELSSPPDASRLPSSAARHRTASVCPSSLASCAPSARFQMMMDLSSLPDASRPPSSAARLVTARVPLELGELRAVREVPDDDGFVAAARREPAAVERGQARTRLRVPLELGELRAVREVPDDDGVVVAARREPAAVERGQAPDAAPCAPSARATAATAQEG